MANIFDYLDWRGDIPLFVDGFNPVDNLILSELAYVDFEGVLPEGAGQQTVDIQMATERYFQLHTEEEVLARNTFTKIAPILLKKTAASRRFSKTRIGRYVNRISTILDEQMAAMTFYLEDGTTYVAFRGTDNTIIGWKEDLNLSFQVETAGQRHAAQYLSEMAELSEVPSPRFLVGGHSKGGNLAVYASAFCKKQVRDKITEIYSNDGPGFLEEVTKREEYQEILPRVHSIIPEGSFFGLLLDSGYSHQIVKSSNKGISQHDAVSWQVRGPRFEETKDTSQVSAFMEKTINRWIESIPKHERHRFVDSLYEMLTSTGAETLAELNADSLAGWRDLFKSFGSMNLDDQRVIGGTVLNLLRTGWDTLSKELSEHDVKQTKEVQEKEDDTRERN